MLYVSNCRRPELSLPLVSPSILWLGGTLGAVAIPLYGIGYRGASRMIAEASPRGARAVFALGVIGGLLGGVIHGLTALHIHADIQAGVVAGDPLSAVAGWGRGIRVLWATAALAVFAASMFFFWYASRAPDRARRWAAFSNPAFGTAALALAGTATPLLQAFLVPAAPNLAHVIFFVACRRAHGMRPVR